MSVRDGAVSGQENERSTFENECRTFGSGGGEGEEDIDEVIGRAIAEQRAKRPPPKRYVMVDPDKLAALTQRAEVAEQQIQRALEEPTQNEHDLYAENQRLRGVVEAARAYAKRPARSQSHDDLIAALVALDSTESNVGRSS